MSTVTGQDCVVDEGSQRKSSLLAITFDLRLCWYSVCEGSEAGGASEGSGAKKAKRMKIQQLATLSKNDLSSKLAKLKQRKPIWTSYVCMLTLSLLLQGLP